MWRLRGHLVLVEWLAGAMRREQRCAVLLQGDGTGPQWESDDEAMRRAPVTDRLSLWRERQTCDGTQFLMKSAAPRTSCGEVHTR